MCVHIESTRHLGPEDSESYHVGHSRISDTDVHTVVMPKIRCASRPERPGDNRFSRPPSVLHDGEHQFLRKSSYLQSAFPDDGHVS